MNDEPVWLGGNSERQDRRFRGFMDEVRVWNHARSATEIRENFVRVLSGYEPGLLTYHTFEEPEANLVFNYAMNGTSEPSHAVPREDAEPVWRPSFSIDKVASPILWEFGTRVVGRHLFYNQSAFDGYDPEATAADDDAIAPNIEALLPGEMAGEIHRSSYSRGINGVIIDIANLRSPLAISEEDFEFAVGNDSDPDSWTPAEPPASILVRPGAGACGSTRITLAWADYQAEPSVPNRAVGNGWLRVTVRANGRTGLHHDDVFHFGSCIGESDDADLLVSAADALRALNHMITSASLLDPHDFNRDGIVSAQDALIALNHTWTSFHLPDLRVGPYKDVDIGGATGSPGLMSRSSPAGSAGASPLFIGPAPGSRIQLTIPPIAAGRGEVAGVILTAPTPSGPWSLLPGGLVPRLPGRDFTIELTPDQPAAFYRLETDTDPPAH